MTPLESFGADLLAWIIKNSHAFFGNEMSEDICPILQRHGFVEFRAYDSARDGESEDGWTDGDMLWFFTDAMREAAKR